MAKVTASDSVYSKVPPSFRDAVVLRVKDPPKFAPNSAGNPMITMKCEIVEPLTKSIDGKTYALDANDVTYFWPLSSIKEPDKTPKFRSRYLDFLRKMEQPEEFDDENPDLQWLDGLCFRAIISSRERIAQRRTEGDKFEAITDAEGKPISQGWEWQANGDDILERVDGSKFADRVF